MNITPIKQNDYIRNNNRAIRFFSAAQKPFSQDIIPVHTGECDLLLTPAIVFFRGNGHIAELKKNFEQTCREFPEDKSYYASMAKAVGLKEDELYKLNSIIGPQQLKYLLGEFKPEHFSVEIIRNEEGQIIELRNIKELKFRVNLHNHTTASDGKMSVEDLLEQARAYADKVAQKLSSNEKIPPFTIAITDHDTVENVQKAINIIAQNPKKYRNLRLVPALEKDFAHPTPKEGNPTEIMEVIGYSINPYSEELNKTLSNIKRKRNKHENELLDRVSTALPLCEFSLEEGSLLNPLIKKGLVSNMARVLNDYFQIKFKISLIVAEVNKKTGKQKSPEEVFARIAKVMKAREKKDFVFVNEFLKKDENLELITTDLNKDALKDIIASVINKIKEENSNFSSKYKDSFSLGRIKYECEKYAIKPNENGEISFVTENSLSDVLKAFEDSKDCIVGFAHPAFIFKNYPEDAEQVVKDIVKKSNGLICAAEINYQSYKSDVPKDQIKRINALCNDLKLFPMGGVDSHFNNIFRRGNIQSELLDATLYN